MSERCSRSHEQPGTDLFPFLEIYAIIYESHWAHEEFTETAFFLPLFLAKKHVSLSAATPRESSFGDMARDLEKRHLFFFCANYHVNITS